MSKINDNLITKAKCCPQDIIDFECNLSYYLLNIRHRFPRPVQQLAVNVLFTRPAIVVEIERLVSKQSIDLDYQ